MATADELCDKGIDLFSVGRLDEAIAAYEQALAIDAGLIDAIHGLAMAYAEKGDLDRAIEAATRITVASPDDPLGYTSLSVLYQRAGRIEDAETAASRARVLEWKQEIQDG